MERARIAIAITKPAARSTRAFVRAREFDFRAFENGPKSRSINASMRIPQRLARGRDNSGGTNSNGRFEFPYRTPFCTRVHEFAGMRANRRLDRKLGIKPHPHERTKCA
jgi:hypothetical protein